MIFKLILENANGDRVDMTTTANQYMTSKVEGLNPPTGTISTSSYAGMDGSYLNNAFIEKRNVVISFEMRGVGVEARRHQLYKVVKPSRYIKIYYATAGIDVFAEGYVESCEVQNFEMLTTGQISILCPDIYWYSTTSVMAYYSQITGSFEVYIAANPQNIEIFQTGRIVGRDDDNQHFGIIESVLIDTDIENGDYLTVRGRFLMCLLERRIIHPTYNVTAAKAYSDIVREVVTQNALLSDNRRIPGLSLGTVTGACWEQTTTLQISYTNLMQWVYTICEKLGGTANIRLVKSSGEHYRMVFDLSEGADRSIMQEDNPHIIFSDAYSNLLSFSYAEDSSVQKNFAYIFGQGKGDERKRTTYCDGNEPTYLDRYELYVDADDISETEEVEGETIPIPEEKYLELLRTRGSERLVLPKTASESDIAAHNTQYVYNRDYYVGDYVTVQHRRFGMTQPQIQLIGMIEGFDQNGRSLTPTFQEV